MTARPRAANTAVALAADPVAVAGVGAALCWGHACAGWPAEGEQQRGKRPHCACSGHAGRSVRPRVHVYVAYCG
eukprot:5498933-Prymnesium_polylepis.1